MPYWGRIKPKDLKNETTEIWLNLVKEPRISIRTKGGKKGKKRGEIKLTSSGISFKPKKGRNFGPEWKWDELLKKPKVTVETIPLVASEEK